MDGDAVSHKEPEKGTDQSRYRFVATFADISAAFAILALLVYILGLIALGGPYLQDLYSGRVYYVAKTLASTHSGEQGHKTGAGPRRCRVLPRRMCVSSKPLSRIAG